MGVIEDGEVAIMTEPKPFDIYNLGGDMTFAPSGRHIIFLAVPIFWFLFALIACCVMRKKGKPKPAENATAPEESTPVGLPLTATVEIEDGDLNVLQNYES